LYLGPFVRNEEAEVTSVRQGDMDELSVTRLSPGTNYTLLIYAENSLGRSAAAFTVYAYTGGEQFTVFMFYSGSLLRSSCALSINQSFLNSGKTHKTHEQTQQTEL